MKSLLRTGAAVFLTLTLTVAAYAGQVQCPAAVPSNSDTTTTIILAVLSVVYS